MFNARSSLATADLGSLPSSVVHRLVPVAPFGDARSTSENAPLLDSAMIMPGNPSICLEDIGLPSDGLWDYDAAYEQRYCYGHGEFEYLLTTPDRWISSDDLGPIPRFSTRMHVDVKQNAAAVSTPRYMYHRQARKRFLDPVPSKIQSFLDPWERHRR
nr:hypothetical protein LTR18_002319 [Exophiala xenobiotica]